MIRITRINHSAINTRDELGAMRRFYVEVLGVQTVARDIPAKFADRIPGFDNETISCRLGRRARPATR